jgi:hypothetical protein
MSPTLAEIRDAAGLIAGVVLRTPFLPAPRLSALTGASLFINTRTCRRPRSRTRRAGRLLASPAERATLCPPAIARRSPITPSASASDHRQLRRRRSRSAATEFRRDGDPRGETLAKSETAVAGSGETGAVSSILRRYT